MAAIWEATTLPCPPHWWWGPWWEREATPSWAGLPLPALTPVSATPKPAEGPASNTEGCHMLSSLLQLPPAGHTGKGPQQLQFCWRSPRSGRGLPGKEQRGVTGMSSLWKSCPQGLVSCNLYSSGTDICASVSS